MNEILFTQTDIRNHYEKTSSLINKKFINEELVIICVLNGGFMYFSDLVKNIDKNITLYLDFIKAKSYDSNTNTQTDNIKLDIDLKINIKGRNIIIVDDIIDSGKTMKSIINSLNKLEPKEIYVCPLLIIDNADVHEFNLIGGIKSSSNYFVAGYGLDNSEQDRHLPYIYVVKDVTEEDSSSFYV